MLETFSQNLTEILGPLAWWTRQFLARAWGPEARDFFLWLAGVLLVIDLLYRFWRRPGTAPGRLYWHPSARLDYKFLLSQQLTNALIMGPMLLSALALGSWGAKILASWLGPGPAWTPGWGVLAGFAVLRLVLFDIGHYISHYLQHKVAFFWEFHKVHHAAEVLTPLTAYRTHPIESVMDSVFQNPLQALSVAAFYYLYGRDHSVTTFAGMNAFLIPCFLISSLRHSHLWISFGPKLEHIFSSPAQHQIHHSSAPQHLDKNMSEYFSFIDWMCGTLYVPRGKETLDFGLHQDPDHELNTVWRFYWVPFKRAFGGLLRPAAALPERSGAGPFSGNLC
ncbi:MAG: sterol desaturase family protein [Acidobacteriota bacterium]|nr:sterol desaturase family protein [Acidobacteriota bacterium]